MSLYRVKINYQKSSVNPLKAKKGEMVSIGNKKSKWKGWFYCTNREGISGWVPEQYLLKLGKNGKILFDYDSTELTAIENERVTVFTQVSGWCLCVNHKGEKGWIPLENLESLLE